MKNFAPSREQSTRFETSRKLIRNVSPPRLLLVLSVWVLIFISAARAQSPITNKRSSPPVSLRQVLIEQLRTTHNQKDWFVPVSAAIAGLSPDQARWVPLNTKGVSGPDANHSVGMIANHLLFWNRRALAQFKGEKIAGPPKDNEETFNKFDAASWNKTVEDLDRVLLEMERFLEQADEARLAELAPTVANISTHNAYHTGQILYVRKLQGSWDPGNGVK